jgi:hypothetical protein
MKAEILFGLLLLIVIPFFNYTVLLKLDLYLLSIINTIIGMIVLTIYKKMKDR